MSVLLSTVLTVQAGPPDQSITTARGYLYDGRAMTKLLAVPFASGRPKLSPLEEKDIVRQTLIPPFLTVLHEPATILVVIGYVDHQGSAEDNQKAALRRAQLVIDLLHDKCQFAGSSQVTTMTADDLPATERANKNARVEIWMVNP